MRFLSPSENKGPRAVYLLSKFGRHCRVHCTNESFRCRQHLKWHCYIAPEISENNTSDDEIRQQSYACTQFH